MAVMDTAAVLGRNAHTVGEQEVVIALTPSKQRVVQPVRPERAAQEPWQERVQME